MFTSLAYRLNRQERYDSWSLGWNFGCFQPSFPDRVRIISTGWNHVSCIRVLYSLRFSSWHLTVTRGDAAGSQWLYEFLSFLHLWEQNPFARLLSRQEKGFCRIYNNMLNLIISFRLSFPQILGWNGVTEWGGNWHMNPIICFNVLSQPLPTAKNPEDRSVRL